MARWLPDGNIEFLGRIDQQVKIRGFRVELGEIESHLMNHPEIKESVVITGQDEKEDKYLCAYIVSHKEPKKSQLREYLSKRLPNYMIPSYFINLDHIPLTPNRKINLGALPPPELEAAAEYAVPRNKLEMEMLELWSDVLGIKKEKIAIHDNFFQLGGHSLKATTLVSRIHKELNVKVPMVEVFENPTVEGLSKYLQAAARDKYASIAPVEEKEYYQLSSAQKRLYILYQLDKSSKGYNIPYVVKLEGELDRHRWEKAFKKLIDRHESLRTSFEIIDEEPVQRICQEVEFEIEYYKAGNRQEAIGNKEERMPDSIIKNFIRPFDLSQAPLLRVGLIKMEEARHLLMVDMHHIVTDGTSQEIFTQDLIGLYENKREELLILRLQYKDFVQWQNSNTQRETIKKQEEYWTQQFEGEIPLLHLPADYSRPAVQSFEGRTIVFEIREKEAAGLNRLALAQGTSLYMVLLALYTIFLAKITGQEDIVVGTPVAGRRNDDLQQIIGMFVNTLGIRNYPGGEKTYTEFLQEVKDRTLEAFENQDYPFEELVEKVKVEREVSRNPLFDVAFALQNIFEAFGDQSEINMEGIKIKPYPHENKISKFDLTLFANEKGEKLH
ncbi:condensation domain-containing protein, partial [Acidobacteriota bacterium]